METLCRESFAIGIETVERYFDSPKPGRLAEHNIVNTQGSKQYRSKSKDVTQTQQQRPESPQYGSSHLACV